MFLQPTVCERELCVFAFQTLGVMNEAADEIATGAQVRVHSYCFIRATYLTLLPGFFPDLFLYDLKQTTGC